MTRKLPIICMEDELQSVGAIPILNGERYVVFDDDGNATEVFARKMDGHYHLRASNVNSNYRPFLERI